MESSDIPAQGSALPGVLARLREDSAWTNLKVVGVISAALGFVSDSLQPLFPLLTWLFPAALIATLCGFVGWLRLCKGKHAPATWPRSLTARTTLCGFIATVVLTPIVVLHYLMPGERGVLVQLGETVRGAQDYLAHRLDRVDLQLGKLVDEAKQSNELLGQMKEGTQNIEQAMNLATALSILDRAKANRSGADQGQIEAVQALTARKHSLASEELSGISFAGGAFNGTDLTSTGLRFSNLNNAQFASVRFDSARLNFATADGAKFLHGTSLKRIDGGFLSARKANFAGISLRYASLFGADLQGADFSNADLTGAVFTFADLTDANFTGATLVDASFTGALLENTRFDSAVMKNTGVFGARRGPATFTPAQLQHACRAALRDDSIQLEIRLQERWTSTRFASGYEYEQFYSYYHYLRSAQDASLPLCDAAQEEPALRFYRTQEGYFAINLDTFFLSKAGREAEAVKKMKDFEARAVRIIGK